MLALCRNSSLQSVEIEASLSDDNRKMIDWFCQRNHMLPSLLASRPSNTIGLPLSIWPRLFDVSFVSTLDATNTTFKALLNLGDLVGGSNRTNTQQQQPLLNLGDMVGGSNRTDTHNNNPC
jgi:hypothetical protein